MYGKIFSQMYDGTLGTEGPWQALVTFQQLIVLADKNGIVDMTAEAIARRTTIPLDVVRVGLVSLEQPDKASRTPDEEGRRIVRLSSGRDWGWRIVNYEKYRTLRSEEERREYHRAYWHKRKLKDDQQTQHHSTDSTESTKAVSSKQYVEVLKEDDPNGSLSGKPDVASQKKRLEESKAIIAFLNECTNRNYQPSASNLNLARARLSEVSLDTVKSVIAAKCNEWESDEKMAQYLRPATLLNATKFAQYLGELPKELIK